MVIIDTNVVIDHLRQPLGKSVFLKFLNKYPRDEICLSIVSIQELYEGSSTRNADREKDLLATVGSLKIFPYTYEVAKKAGEIARDMKRPISSEDAAIAATVIIQGASLYTLDKRDFQGIEDLSFATDISEPNNKK